MYKVDLVEGVLPGEGIKKKSVPIESTQYQTVQVHAGPQGQLGVVRAR